LNGFYSAVYACENDENRQRYVKSNPKFHTRHRMEIQHLAASEIHRILSQMENEKTYKYGRLVAVFGSYFETFERVFWRN
jgi:hypothetical protein